MRERGERRQGGREGDGEREREECVIEYSINSFIIIIIDRYGRIVFSETVVLEFSANIGLVSTVFHWFKLV